MRLIITLAAVALACVAAVGIAAPVPMPRTKAPAFAGKAVIGTDFVQRSLADFAGKYLVLLFYPFDFTFVCPTELTAFSDALQQISGLGAELLAVSTDSQYSHLAWLNTPRSKGGVNGLRYPLFADVSKEMSRAYGVLVEDPQDDLFGAPLRGLFIVDRDGIIRHAQVTDASVGRNVDEVVRLISAFQYVDKHGEVCPHGWRAGSDTIKPTPAEKIEYFSKVFHDEN